MSCIATSFAPIGQRSARSLILGSMPGIKSLEVGEYYANPRNAFWPIMGALFQVTIGTYPSKVALIENNDLALWDVLRCCERDGSTDAAIEDASIEVNDFVGFLTHNRHIDHVFFNGWKAEKEFRKRVQPLLPQSISARLTLTGLPSTSPAMTSLTKAARLECWRQVRR